MNKFFINRLLFGIFIIGIGILFLLKQTGQIEFDVNIGQLLSTYWPVILIFLGLQGLLTTGFNGPASGWWGAGMMLMGFVFLGHNLDWFTWSIGDIISYIWPIAIILVGINMIRRPKKDSSNYDSPKNEWKSYTGNDGHVPPAPPLHPDPTKPKAEDDVQHAYESESSYKEEDSSEYEEVPSYKKHYQKHLDHHRKKHYHKHHHKNHREEYWNHDPNAQTRSGFIGDIHIGHDYWELKPMNIAHFIGDTVVDLTKAQIAVGETKLCISSFIGDVKVYVPNDYEIGIQVVSSAFVGDVKILGQQEGGLFKNMNIYSPDYKEATKRIKLVVSTFIGDVRVTKVG
ncbi:cell wall-active antibiotics response protein LiaF [Paenibacillus sp. NEAU-GSW1]|uniref:cell wall-active antibiotics response protein LiaF n=1 Tax=Paenibacillus sp. NEAU-GSW1 TaxID=2682486 RepID=UPI0012E1BDD3|nr:cell wall-active antibiotics response protein LiaF [Paenibacillus sp. NEAU-GSW1]MUT64362.1 hypothetical protein [Paenibacillus sp. NEAU-GSW1]